MLTFLDQLMAEKWTSYRVRSINLGHPRNAEPMPPPNPPPPKSTTRNYRYRYALYQSGLKKKFENTFEEQDLVLATEIAFFSKERWLRLDTII